MILASDKPVTISRRDFERMLAFSQQIYRLKYEEKYVQRLESRLPETARVRPEAPGILMGFDFHLTEDGPKLIEINNNAGGLYIGPEDSPEPWLPQPDIDELPGRIETRLVQMFPRHWQTIAIVDETIEQQFMFPEMKAYARLLEADGRRVFLASPEDLKLEADGLYCNNSRLDAIYNRHTDFYLESAEMTHIRTAYLSGQVQLNPHPRSYALLGDKARMADWWGDGLLDCCLTDGEIELVRTVVPETHLMIDHDPEQTWQERNRWVFKPVARHGGKGVLLGKSISRKRFNELDRDETVMQEFVPASLVEINDTPFKLDIRLFTQGEKLVAVAGRAWQGQVTNFRSEGSGWVVLSIE